MQRLHFFYFLNIFFFSLIEEFMLLANMTVAKHLYEVFPEISLLRSHDEPSSRILKKTQELLAKFGIILDTNSAGLLNNSLLKLNEANDTEVARYRWMVINNLCAKSMTVMPKKKLLRM